MRIRIALIVAALLVLCGCGEDSVESSLKVPELPAEFVEFNDEINKIKDEGYELISPVGGTNRQSVQLADLDGDGTDEGVAFFRELANSHNVYAYFFKKSEEGYGVTAKIKGSGDTVENVSYGDLMGTGNNDVVIGWSISDSSARSVGAYSIVEGDAIKLCEVNSIYHIVCDLDSDMVSDLCVVYQDPADGMQKLAIYSQKEGSLLFCSSAPISNNGEDILRIRAAYTESLLPAIFIEKRHGSAGLVTDVIVWNESYLENITYSDEKNGNKTARMHEAFAEDIDGDGALEIPMPQMLTYPYAETDGSALMGTNWYSVDVGSYKRELFAFRSSAENWNLTLPLDWADKCVAVYKKDMASNTTVFYSHRENKTDEELFSIVMLTGENREKNMEKMGYEKLIEKNEILYAVKIEKNTYLGYDITPEMLAERFTYRQSEWSTGEVVF